MESEKGNSVNVEAVLFLILSLGFLAFSPARVHLAALNAIHRSELWEKRSNALTQLGVFYGLAFLCLAGLSCICARKGGSLTGRVMAYLLAVPSAVRAICSDTLRKGIFPRDAAFWLAAAVVAGTGIRVFFLNSPMKWDESDTFLQYIQCPFVFVFEYTAPNNHVLNSILERISTLILGKYPVAIRLPAFLAGVMSIPLSFWVCRALSPRGSGCFAAVAVAACPYLIMYSANGRGYSLVVFLTLLLVLIGFKYVNNPTRGGLGLIAIVSALGLYTMPSMLFMVAGTSAWIAWLLLSRGNTARSVLFEFAIPCGGLTTALTALLYTPVVLVSGGFEYILHNRFVRPQPWGSFFRQLGPHVWETAGALASGVPRLALVAIAILIVTGFYASARDRNWPMFMLLPLVVTSSVVVLIAQHRIPFERTWIYLLPLFIVVADAGFARLLEMGRPRIQSAAIGVLFLLATILGLRLVRSYPAVQYCTDAGEEFPEARIAAQFLKPMLVEGDAVRTSLSAEQPTFFYLWYETSVVNPRTHRTARPQVVFYAGDHEANYSFTWYHDLDNPRIPVTTEPHRMYYVLKKGQYTLDSLSNIHIFVQSGETLDVPGRSVVKILDYRDMAIYRQVNAPDPSVAKS